MNKVCCDFCGGNLIMQSGGSVVVCDNCGMQYSVERLQEKLRESKGRVVINGTVRTQDTEFVIRGGVLERYNGNDVYVTIPDTVIKVGTECFKECAGIKGVVLPHGITEIGAGAFYGCKSLEKIDLPDTLVDVGFGAFDGCSSLKEITIPDSTRYLSSWAFANCSSLQVVKLPEGLVKIGSNAFEGCIALETINIPGSIETIADDDDDDAIGGGGFPSCKNLKNVILPPDAEKIICTHYDLLRSANTPLERKCRLLCFAFWGTPWYKAMEEARQMELWKAEHKCRHCGHRFNIFSGRCMHCGKPKDY